LAYWCDYILGRGSSPKKPVYKCASIPCFSFVSLLISQGSPYKILGKERAWFEEKKVLVPRKRKNGGLGLTGSRKSG
ncbi:hypothetical protein C9J01_27040, partial [Photobacterium rosenbergii]